MVVGMFKERRRKAFSVLFQTIILSIYFGHKTLCHMFTYAYIYKENMRLFYLLHLTQQIELGYLPLLFLTLVWICTLSVITRAMPTGKGEQ